MMLYNACVGKQRADLLASELKAIKQELVRVKKAVKNLELTPTTQTTPTTPSSTKFDMGDYE